MKGVRTRRGGVEERWPRLQDWILDAESEPFRRDWLELTPVERLERSWRMRRALKSLRDPEDALPLPLA